MAPDVVRRGATIGANATIVCGVTIGEHAFVAAGAVVARDVAQHALVAGNPARFPGAGSAPAASACPRAQRRPWSAPAGSGGASAPAGDMSAA